MTDCPPQAYVAALAGFRNMNVHRLSALLRHHGLQRERGAGGEAGLERAAA